MRGYGRFPNNSNSVTESPHRNIAIGTFAIVGVISDVRQTRVIDAPVRQEFYVALAQQANPPRIMTLLVRSTMDPAKLTDAARKAIRSVDSEQPIYYVNPID